MSAATGQNPASPDPPPQDEAPKVLPPFIFISYARADFAQAALIEQRLKDTYGSSAVYMDSSSIQPATSWLVALNKALEGTLLLVLIVSEKFAEKVSSEADYVRQEIESALGHGAQVLPVLVDRARMPAMHSLPESLKPVAEVHAEYLRPETPSRDLDFVAKAVDSVLTASCAFDPSYLPQHWDEARRETFQRLPDHFRRKWDFHKQRALLADARTQRKARVELAVRYQLGIGPRSSPTLGMHYLAWGLESSGSSTMPELAELDLINVFTKPMLLEMAKSSKPVAEQLAAAFPGLHVGALCEAALEGDSGAEAMLRGMADKGNADAISAMSMVMFAREVAPTAPRPREEPRANDDSPPSQEDLRPSQGDSSSSQEKDDQPPPKTQDTAWPLLFILIVILIGAFAVVF